MMVGVNELTHTTPNEEEYLHEDKVVSNINNT